VSVELWQWWEQRLTEAQRQALIAMGSCELPPDLALELWRSSGRLHIVEPETWTIDADPNRWRLTAEVRDFVGQRQYEHAHPEDE
jgi:hypothetical protein